MPLSKMNSLDNLTEKLRKLTPGSLKSGKAVQVEVLYGQVIENIVQFSHDQKSDLIIMGLKSPPAFFADRRLWLYASAIISDAYCPVLTVRQVV